MPPTGNIWSLLFLLLFDCDSLEMKDDLLGCEAKEMMRTRLRRERLHLLQLLRALLQLRSKCYVSNNKRWMRLQVFLCKKQENSSCFIDIVIVIVIACQNCKINNVSWLDILDKICFCKLKVSLILLLQENNFCNNFYLKNLLIFLS